MHGISRFFLRRSRFSYCSAVVLLTVAPAAWWAIAAPLTGPQASDYRVTKVVESYMTHEHLSGRDLDDEISRRAMKAFLES